MIKSVTRAILEDKKKKDFLIYGVGQAFNLLSPLVVAPYIISVCHEEGLGKTGLGFALSLFLILIVDYAFEIKGTKAVAEKRDDKSALQDLLNLTIFTKMILFGITAIIALLLIFMVEIFSQEKELFLFSMMIVFAQVFSPVWFLQGVEKFKLGSALNIGSKAIYVALIYVFIRVESDYRYVNLYLGSSSLFFNLFGLLIIKKRYGFNIVPPRADKIKEVLQADFTFCLSQLSLSVRQLSPLVLTGIFLGYHIAGLYRIVEHVITLFRTFIQVFLKFFYPALCIRMAAQLSDGFQYWKKYSLLIIACVAAPLLLIFFFSETVLRFFTDSVHSIGYLDPILKLTLLVPFLMAFTLPLEQLMFSLNTQKVYVRIAMSVTVINVLLILTLISEYGLNGVILSLIIAEALFIIFYLNKGYYQIQRKIK